MSASPSTESRAADRPLDQGVDKSGARVQAMFGEIAPRYDRMNHVLSGNVDRWWRRVTVKTLAPKPGDKILDACTGTGDLALAFWRYLDGDATVIGTDFCDEMLDIARDKAAKLTPGDKAQLGFQTADTQALPFADDSFDIVTVAFGLRNVEDTGKGLRELARVCRPGGQVAVLEFSTPRRWPIRPLYAWYFKNILPRLGALFARNKHAAYDYLPQSVGEFPAYEALATLMEESGIHDVSWRALTFGIATLYVGRK